MQAIETRYIGATNTKGSRIKATAEAGTITIPYPYDAKGVGQAHREAADALRLHLATKIAKSYNKDRPKDKRMTMEQTGWLNPMVGGALPKERGYAFVFVKGAY